MKTYQKVIIALIICAIGGGAVLWLVQGKKTPEAPIKEPTPVEVVKAKSGSILRRVSTVGNLSAVQSVVLFSETTGKVAKIYFQEGENVKKGDPLFKIDDAIYKVKVKQAEADLALKKEEYSRAIKLLEKNFGTIQMRDKTLAEMQVAEAALEEAKINLENTVIKAPFDGVMGLTELSVGSLVVSNTELGTIVDLDPIYVDTHIPESYLPYVHVGDIVDVTIEDFDILPVEAKIIAIAPEIDEATRTVTIRAEMPNKELAYRPNEFARVLVLAGKIEDAVLIPEGAIERDGEEEHVFLVVDNVAVRSTVSTGMRDGNEVEVTHGIKDGDFVISAGQFKVHDGDEVTVVNQEKAK
ncbi:MAG TPA: efflux RND transporter periplasmic adaptor subunit [Alphaproteobacteria bacterium]|nr:efflux RND transporter periplasmic adaptor subunit [Alphaproteobacteria bacterium]